jgi:hypothetical protein
MTGRNLRAMYNEADADDIREGKLAYWRYNGVIREFADTYNAPLDRALAAFCALSPNNDYYGNLRSMASVLYAVQHDIPCDEVTVSTYKHCRDRAYSYVTGETSFLGKSKGPKIRAFYHNILDPDDCRYVTIDGHMKAAYEGVDMTMKEAIVRTKGEYKRISDATMRLAKLEGLVPNQLQATIWFARKRTRRIKYNAQLGLFDNPSDKWGTVVRASDALPYL